MPVGKDLYNQVRELLGGVTMRNVVVKRFPAQSIARSGGARVTKHQSQIILYRQLKPVKASLTIKPVRKLTPENIKFI